MSSIPCSKRMLGVALATAVLAVGGVVLAQNPPGAGDDAVAPIDDGPSYVVTELSLAYIRTSRSQPALSDLSAERFVLGRLDGEYVQPRFGVELVETSIDDLNAEGSKRFRFSAVQHMLESILGSLTRRDFISVFVAPDPLHIDESGADLRGGNTALRILIATGVVSEVRTLAAGERVESGEIPEEARVNHPLHDRIRARSPIQPSDRAHGNHIDLLRKDLIDDYIFHLSRHPGRRVDVSLAPSEDLGGVTLDYEITENRPVVIYGQVSNTGTAQTERLRERFGFIHHQLTNNDDILSVDYTTTNFQDSHGVTASYESPFCDDRIRWRVYGQWSQYTASEIGFFNSSFRGDSWSAGAEIIANVFQDRELFIDLVGGVRFDDFEVRDTGFGVEGSESFIVPYVGARLERVTEWFATHGSLMFEIQSEAINNADLDELEALGRLDPDDEWVTMHWDVGHAFYLEPLLDPKAWADPTTPESSTLAHEIALSVRGQHAFGSRLIPQAQDVIGGLYTVRGYPESVIAGDSIVVASAEYRFHVPRAFGTRAEPGELFGRPFRWAPQYVYGQPDWDLILKAFVDVGRAWQSDRASFETDETLLGLGVGAELQIRRNLNIRLDWGFAIEGMENGEVNSGSNRLHFVATLLF